MHRMWFKSLGQMFEKAVISSLTQLNERKKQGYSNAFPRSENERLRILVYSPNSGGHRHLYLKAITDILIQYDVRILIFFIGQEMFVRNTCRYMPHNSVYLREALCHKNVKRLRTNDYNLLYTDELEFIRQMQRSCNADITYFIDGDRLTWVFCRQLLFWKGCLYNKNYAMFIHSEFLYDCDKPLFGALPSRYWFFHFFLHKQFKLLDGAFYTDENIVKTGGTRKYVHIPDLPNPSLITIAREGRKGECSQLMRQIQAFLDRNKAKTLILCFGDLHPGKGFDFLLKLAVDEKDTIVLRVGRTKPGYTPEWEDIGDKEILLREDRILEIDGYIDSSFGIDIEDLLKLPNFMLLPYRGFYRTSGVMLDVLNMGKPVVVPDVGLMKTRVEENGIGLTFHENDYSDFRRKYNTMKEGWQLFVPYVKKYAQTFSSEQVSKTVSHVIGMPASPDVVGPTITRGTDLKKAVRYREIIPIMRKFILPATRSAKIVKDIRRKWNEAVHSNDKCVVAVIGSQLFLEWLEDGLGLTGSKKLSYVIALGQHGCRNWWGIVPSSLGDPILSNAKRVILGTEKDQDMLINCWAKYYGKRAKFVDLCPD